MDWQSDNEGTLKPSASVDRPFRDGDDQPSASVDRHPASHKDRAFDHMMTPFNQDIAFENMMSPFNPESDIPMMDAATESSPDRNVSVHIPVPESDVDMDLAVTSLTQNNAMVAYADHLQVESAQHREYLPCFSVTEPRNVTKSTQETVERHMC